MSSRSFLARVLAAILTFATSLSGSQATEQKLTVTWLASPIHGLAVVLETPGGKTVLVDTGGVSKTPDYNAGRDTIAPFLDTRSHQEIEAIIISHPHGDHYGGAEWLLQNRKVARFIDNGYEGRGQTPGYTRLRSLATERGGAYETATAGQLITIDPAITVEVFSPPALLFDTQSDPAKVSDHGLLNSNSIVLRVQHGENVFLFPGDAYGGSFERHLKTLPPEKLRATVLTAPHHGFNPGIDFPKMVQPKYVVASCVADYPGNANTPYPRSPGDHAIKTFTPLGAEVFVTAFQGNITAVSDGHRVTMSKDHERAAP